MRFANGLFKRVEGRNNFPGPDSPILPMKPNRISIILPAIPIIAAVLFLSGCSEYALKKDLTDLKQNTTETKQELNERLSRIEQAPKADPEALTALAERVNKISLYALELERRLNTQLEPGRQPEPQPQMTLGVRALTVEDITGLITKINELDRNLKSMNVTKEVALNSVSFPLGKIRVEELSAPEMSKLRENAMRIKEEKPSKVEITAWADGSGTPDKREYYASERAKSVEDYYRKNAGEGAAIEFLTVFKIASASGPFWRRADTTMWMTEKQNDRIGGVQ